MQKKEKKVENIASAVYLFFLLRKLQQTIMSQNSGQKASSTITTGI